MMNDVLCMYITWQDVNNRVIQWLLAQSKNSSVRPFNKFKTIRTKYIEKTKNRKGKLLNVHNATGNR